MKHHKRSLLASEEGGGGWLMLCGVGVPGRMMWWVALGLGGYRPGVALARSTFWSLTA